MFGYIRPYKPEMLIKHYEMYKSVYCGLCKQLGKDYGLPARLILSYDCTFFVLISFALKSNSTHTINRKSCTCNPLKKCNYCVMSDNSMEAAAAFSIISFYYKLSDNIADESHIKSIISRILRLLMTNKMNLAVKKFPEYNTIVKEMLKEQFESEKVPSCSIDKAADPTAKMLSRLVETLAENSEDKNIYSRFGYFLGRWVYIIDAVDDFEKDKNSGAFNPLVLKFSDNLDISFDNEEFKEYCNGLLNQTMAHILISYNQMKICNFNDIIENIIKQGMPEMQKNVIFNRSNKDKI